MRAWATGPRGGGAEARERRVGRRSRMRLVERHIIKRADPRFASFSDEIRLGDYWRATGTRPDILPSDRAYRSA